MTRLIRPMLATLTPKPFHRPGWVYEEKYDGVRALAYRRGRRVRLYSRTLRDITTEFPEIARALQGLPDGDLVLDGEIVAFDRHAVSGFHRHHRTAPAARCAAGRPVGRSRSPVRREGRDGILQEGAGRSIRPNASPSDRRVPLPSGAA